jgi:hypothetical protein
MMYPNARAALHAALTAADLDGEPSISVDHQM